MAKKHAPVEAKTIAADGAAAGGTVLSGFIVWLLAVTIWGADWHKVDLDVVKVVPTPVILMVGLVVIPGAVHGFSWFTHHTPRPEEAKPTKEVVE